MSALADRVEVMLSFRAWRGISQDTRLFLFLALRKNKETKKGKQGFCLSCFKVRGYRLFFGCSLALFFLATQGKKLVHNIPPP
jgi:hypothetical protein